MNSPFPGMDPYLEPHWRDVHSALVTYARDQLQPRLPRDLRARMETRVYVETEDEGVRGVHPDVKVVEATHPKSNEPANVSGVAVAEPFVVILDEEPVTERLLQIVDVTSGNRVVTLLEFLSPTNKRRGGGMEKYLQKRREARAAGANTVEIDLTRRGRRAAVLPQELAPPEYQSVYQAQVRRATSPARLEIYRVELREALPSIRIPLREQDEDVPLELQPLIELAYSNGGYEADVDYTVEPTPPFETDDDARWGDELLRAAGLR